MEIESAGKTCTFQDGYCAFNFASTCDKLAQTFAEVPLLLELIEKDAASPLTAICKLDLRKVNECEEDMERKKLLVMKPPFRGSERRECGSVNSHLLPERYGFSGNECFPTHASERTL